MINYVKGDATYPVGDGNKIISHVCNNVGGWGRGFVLAVSKRWKDPERFYRQTFNEGLCKLGEAQFVPVIQTYDGLTMVANMIAQVGYGPKNVSLHRIEGVADNVPPIRYDALRSCLIQVADEAKRESASIHMPRIGCGLAGGKWETVENIILETLDGIVVTVYDL